MAVSTSAFFDLLYPTGFPPGALLELRIDTGGGIARQFVKNTQDAIFLARKHYDTAKSIWFGPGLRYGPGGTDADVKWIPALWIDCDNKCFASHETQEAYEWLMRYRVPPDVVIDSGHGVQGYWLSDVDYYTGDDILRAREAMRLLQQKLSEGLIRKLDSTHNPNRMMRMPNTMNRKEAAAVPCRIVHNAPNGGGRRLETLFRSELDQILPQLAKGVPTSNFPSVILITKDAARALLDVALDKGMTTWVHDALYRPDMHHRGDTSRLDFAVCCHLTQYLTLEEAEAVWFYSPLGQRPGDNKVVARPDYRHRTLTKAYEASKHE